VLAERASTYEPRQLNEESLLQQQRMPSQSTFDWSLSYPGYFLLLIVTETRIIAPAIRSIFNFCNKHTIKIITDVTSLSQERPPGTFLVQVRVPP